MNETIRRMLENPWVELAARWILGATFIVASYHKIVDPEGFAEAIYSYGLFPGNTINLIAIILPFLELFSGLALVFGVYRRAAVIVVSVMLILFIGALTINFIRGHQFDCGCFSFKGENAQSDAWILLLRDVLLLALGMFVFAFRGNRRYCIQRVS